MTGRVVDWIRRRQQELSDAVHAAADERARDHGWEITKGIGRLGFGARTYRNPHSRDQRRVPAEANTLSGAEWLINAGVDPGPIGNLMVGNEAGDCQAVLEAGSDMATPEAANPVELSAIARLLASDMREELLVLLREIFERNALLERLAYSREEAADLLGISRELVHDLLRTGQAPLSEGRTPQADRQTPP
jgi:hypothetical protein